MKAKIPMIVRVLLGLLFFASGVAGLFNLAPMPPDLPEKLVAFTSGLMASTYFMPFLKLTEIVCGLLLITGWFVPLALVILAPIVIHIFMVHAFLQPSGLPIAIVIGVMVAYLSFFVPPYSNVIKKLFEKNAR